jgi:hypothetical protein
MTILSVKLADPGVNLAAAYLFEKGYGDHGDEKEPKTFEDLTDADKLAIVQAYQKQVVVDLANTFKSQKAQEVARTTEEASKYSL